MEDFDVLARIQELCDLRSWTYYRLAKEADIPYSTLSTMLRKTNAPTVHTLQKLCAGFGMSPAVPTIALAVVVAGNYLMPVNPTVMLTYGEGYYTFGDMFKTGIIPSIVLVLLMAAWMPFIVGILGI